VRRREWFAAAAGALAGAAERVALKDIETALKLSLAGDAAHALANRLRAVRRSPLIEGRRLAFVFEGAARQVEVAGMVAPDRPFAMRRLPGAAVWVSLHEFGDDVRFSYHLVVDGKAMPDPWNVERTPDGESVVVMPRYRVPRECEPGPGVPRGRFETLTQAAAYVPPGPPAALLLVLDGSGYRAARLPAILDSLTARRRLPPLLALFWEGALPAEALTPAPAFANSLREGVLREAGGRWNLPADPADRAILGAGAAGLAAFHAAWQAPEVFGRVLTQSADFAAHPEALRYPEWIRAAPTKPLRLHMTLASHDPEAVRDANHLVWGALRQQRYDFTSYESDGFRSFDTWQQQLPRALEELWRGFGR
jgi:enterochelin esterase-like enzyme